MQLSRNKTRNSTIAFVLMLTVAATVITIIPAAAQKIPTDAFLSVTPNPVGLGQYVVVSFWITPPPPWDGNWAHPPIPYEGYTVTITKPGGTTETKGPFTSFGSGSMYFTYTPATLGTYSAKFSFPGDATHTASESRTMSFTVQQEKIPDYPGAQLPTGYWERPINSENREWFNLAGNWLSSSWSMPYNASIGSFNPYSTGPKTAHILWRKPVGLGGLVGGEYGSQAFNRLEDVPATAVYPILMAGRVYYTYMDKIHCLDMNTGEELWAIPGSGTIYGQAGPAPTLWAFGGEYVNYDAFSGSVLKTISGVPGWAFGGGTYVIEDVHLQLLGGSNAGAYIYIANGRTNITKYDLNGYSPVFEDNIIWSTDWPANATGFGTTFGGAMICDGVLVTGGFIFPGDPFMGVDTETGDILWAKTFTETMLEAQTLGYGKYYTAMSDLKWHAFNVHTGAEVWESEPMGYPWGDFNSYTHAVAYGKVYTLSYDGYLRAFNAETGDTEWKFFAGNTSETGTGQYAFWTNPVVADGKIYATTGLHSTGGTLPRGDKLYCLDANTGDVLWSISHLVTTDSGAKAIADGKLVTVNHYDGCMYAFYKGQTATTVSVSQNVISNGSSTLIQGTVLDKSPAQPDTPAISDTSMSAWMGYLHMQKPMPTNAIGVPVQLRAMRSDGSIINIGTVTSDVMGHFERLWTPPAQDTYKILATFAGSDSYWTSSAETALGVTAAPSTPPEPEPAPATDYTPMFMGIIAAVAVAIIIGIVNLYTLRKRK